MTPVALRNATIVQQQNTQHGKQMKKDLKYSTRRLFAGK